MGKLVRFIAKPSALRVGYAVVAEPLVGLTNLHSMELLDFECDIDTRSLVDAIEADGLADRIFARMLRTRREKAQRQVDALSLAGTEFAQAMGKAYREFVAD